MLKRYPLGIASPTGSRWTKTFIAHVREEILPTMELAVAAKLECLFDRYEMFRAEQNKLDKAIDQLANSARYKHAYRRLRELPGVGRLVAMTFLTEMGDLTRFSNRREIGAYLGLCPSSHESGETDNRKGRITGQGPSRLRKLGRQLVEGELGYCRVVPRIHLKSPRIEIALSLELAARRGAARRGD